MVKKNLLIMALGFASLWGGSVFAAPIDCVVTPKNSIIADGETLQLSATCTGGALSSIGLRMDGVAVTEEVTLASHEAGDVVTFTVPVGLKVSGNSEYLFTVTGVASNTSANESVTSTTAKVIVKPSSAVVAAAQGVSSPTVPAIAACGTAINAPVTSTPSEGTLCQTGSRPALLVSGPASYSWSCISLTGGAEAHCYTARSAPLYTVTTSVTSGGGSVSPSQHVAAGDALTVTATPGVNPTATWQSNCGGTPSGNTYSISAVNASCYAKVAFTATPVAVNGSCDAPPNQPLSAAPTTNLCLVGGASSVTTGASSYSWTCAGTNGGSTSSCSAPRSVVVSGDGAAVGSGLWAPGGSTTRTVADVPGPEVRLLSYLPGCLNGALVGNAGSGCGALTSFTGTLIGTSEQRTVSFVAGKELVLRYRTKANANTALKRIKVKAWNGGNIGTTTNVWLSADPNATFASVSAACKSSSATVPSIITGPGYCPVPTSNPVYYLGIEYTGTTAIKLTVDESSSDLY